VPRIERRADVVWEGNVARGRGLLTAGSGAFSELPLTLATRIGAAEGQTSPEELIAAAHAGCYAMSLTNELAKLGRTPERVEVSATCVMDEVGDRHLVVASQLDVRARVPELDDDTFLAAVSEADAGCPISALIRASAEVRIDAILV
jgi:osmotically inducible protein OsmC